MRARLPAGTRWYGKARAVWSIGDSPAGRGLEPVFYQLDVAWLATRPTGITEPYGELVQHRVVLGYDA
jgi:hypothetical protein